MYQSMMTITVGKGTSQGPAFQYVKGQHYSQPSVVAISAIRLRQVQKGWGQARLQPSCMSCGLCMTALHTEGLLQEGHQQVV